VAAQASRRTGSGENRAASAAAWASRRASSPAAPSACRRATSTAATQPWSGSQPRARQQQRATKRRACRRLILGPRCASIAWGSCEANHSCSVMLSLPAEQEVYRETTSNVRLRLSQMSQKFCVVAPGVFEGVGHNRQAVQVEVAGGQDALLVGG